MSFLHLLVLTIVQGITEFLPISSSGHLVLIPRMACWPDQGLDLDVAVHVGTLAAVLVYFWRDIGHVLLGLIGGKSRERRAGRALAFHVLISLPPVVLAGGAIAFLAPDFFRSPLITAWATLGFAFVLWFTDRFGLTVRRVEHMTVGRAFTIGMAQVLALIPGTSRSGITMSAARMLGFERAEAARFSMLMSIPVIVAAGTVAGYDLYKNGQPIVTGDAGVAAALSFLTALAAIAVLMSLLKRLSFTPFVIYRIVLGAGLLVWMYYFPGLRCL